MDEAISPRRRDQPDFCGFKVDINYSKDYFLSGDELVLAVTLNRSESSVSDSTLHCVSVYVYGIATFSSKILNGEKEAKEFETSFAKECITFPFLTNELDRISKDERLRLIFSTDAALLEPSITNDIEFANKTYRFKIVLPPFLPPSFAGKYTKIRYSTCLSAQQSVNGDFQRVYLQFPFTLIGSHSSKLPTIDRSHLPVRALITNITGTNDNENGNSIELYSKIYDWWVLMNEDSGFDYEGIGAANFKKFIYNFLLQGVEAMELRNQPYLNSEDLLDYETLMEQRQIGVSNNSDFFLLKIVSNGMELCTIKLYGTENSVFAESDNNLTIKLNSQLKIDFDFFCEKYMLKVVQITLTAHEAYRLDFDVISKTDRDEFKNSLLSVHSLQKVVISPYKEIYNKTILKRFIYCSSYETTSLELHIPYLEPSFNWDDIALYYKLNFYFHISETSAIGTNKVELSPFSKYKAASHAVNTILIP